MRKSFVLILVSGLLFLTLAIFSFYYFSLRSHIDRVDGGIDETIAFYICEAGLTAAVEFYLRPGAVLEPRKEYIVKIPIPFQDYTYDGFTIPSKEWDVHFKVVEQPGTGEPEFTVWLKSPRGFRNRTYYLEATASRTFPVFIKAIGDK